MKTIRPITRRQTSLAACGLALLGVLTIIPWQVVAQDAKPTTKPPVEQATKSDNAAVEKLLVGTWRGRNDADVTFFGDGTMEEYPCVLFTPEASDPPAGRVRGTWNLKDENGSPRLVVHMTSNGISLRGLPEIARPHDALAVQYEINRIDDKLLRLTCGDAETQFYHRLDSGAAGPKYDPSIPASFRKLAELAHLSPEEALAASEYFKANQIDIELTQFNALQKLDAAKHSKIDFAELFNLNQREAPAYADLYKLTRGNMLTARSLNDSHQLSEFEIDALKKVDQYATELAKDSNDAKQMFVQFAEAKQLVPRPNGPDEAGRVNVTDASVMISARTAIEYAVSGLPLPTAARGRGGRSGQSNRNSLDTRADEHLNPEDRKTYDALEKLAHYAWEENVFFRRTVLSETR